MALAPLALVQVGCSSSKGAPSGETPSPDSGAVDSAVAVPEQDAGGDAESAPTGLSLTWNVNLRSIPIGLGEGDAGDAAAPAQPVPGVTACVMPMASIPCATTDSTGTFTLSGLPASTDLVVTLVATGFRSIAVPIQTSTGAMNATTSPLTMMKTSDPDPSIGATIDWADAGQLQFFALGPGALLPGAGPEGAPGASVTLAPAPVGGVGPLFLTDENTFDASAKALIDVAGVVYNVTPGTYSLTFGDPAGDCEPIASPFAGWGYPGATHDVTFPILAGYTTTAGVYCTPNTQADAGPDGAVDAAFDAAGPADAAADGPAE
jgi:hypothetical protein